MDLISVDTKEFAGALAKIKKFNRSSKGAPFMDVLSLEAKDGSLMITGDPMDSPVLQVSIPCSDGNALVTISGLKKVAASMGKLKRFGGRVGIVIGNKSVTLSHDKSSTDWTIYDRSQEVQEMLAGFDQDANDIEGSSFTLDADKVKHILESSIPLASTEASRSSINGLHFDKAYVIATDGHRLRRMKYDDSVDFPGITVPLEACSQMLELIKLTKVDSVGITFGKKGRILLTVGDSRTIAYESGEGFPHYTSVIPSLGHCSAIVDRKKFLEILSLLPIVAPYSSGSVKLVFSPQDSIIEISAGAAKMDPMEGVITLEVHEISEDTAPRPLGFNYKYLEAMVKDLTGDKIYIWAVGTLSPVNFSNEDKKYDDDDLYIIMPMRL